MIALEPSAVYNYEFDKIWFCASIFVVLHNKNLAIYKYPNIKLRQLKASKDIESVKITNKIQLLYKNNKTFYPEDIIFEVPVVKNNNFRFKSKKIYYKNKPVFCVNGEYNVVINEDELKAYQYTLENNLYVIKEFDLYVIVNGFIFDRSFFVRSKLKYDQNFIFGSNRKDFCICIDDLLVLNLVKKKCMSFRIANLEMSCKNILLAGQNSLITVLDMNLNVLVMCSTINYFYNKYIGFVCVTNDSINKKVLDNIIVSGTTEQINAKIDATQCQNNDLVQNESINIMCSGSKMYKIQNINLLHRSEDAKLYFSIKDNNLACYKLKDSNFSVMKNESNVKSKPKIKIFDLELQQLQNIDDVEFCDVYLDRILIITKHHIVLILNDYTCKKNKIENIYDCSAECLTINYIKNNKTHIYNVYDMFLSILTQNVLKTKEYIDKPVLMYAETFLHKILMLQMYEEAKTLICNIKNDCEQMCCKLYRKGDDNIRLFFDKHFTHIFDNIKNANNLFIIYNCKDDISIAYLAKLCTEQDKDDLIVNLHQFLCTHSPAKLIDLEKALWEANNIKMLKHLNMVDLEDYTNLNRAINKF